MSQCRTQEGDKGTFVPISGFSPSDAPEARNRRLQLGCRRDLGSCGRRHRGLEGDLLVAAAPAEGVDLLALLVPDLTRVAFKRSSMKRAHLEGLSCRWNCLLRGESKTESGVCAV